MAPEYWSIFFSLYLSYVIYCFSNFLIFLVYWSLGELGSSLSESFMPLTQFCSSKVQFLSICGEFSTVSMYNRASCSLLKDGVV